MKKDLDSIIRENLRTVLSEMDVVPTDKQNNSNLVNNQATNAWRMIYRLMDNVKTSMDATLQGKKQYDEYGKFSSSNSITNQDVDNIIDYIYNGLQNITRNTIGSKI